MPLPNAADAVLLLHNPKCSKSRATRALLEERGVSFEERLYLEDPLDVAELRELGERLALPPQAWLRTGESAFAASGLDAEAGAEQVLEAIAASPVLMQRPIVVRGRKAAIGRPPERVLELF